MHFAQGQGDVMGFAALNPSYTLITGSGYLLTVWIVQHAKMHDLHQT
jgi:hypothetical protein